jgi:hypothetical protein
MKKYTFYFDDFEKKVPGSLSKNKWKCPRKKHTHSSLWRSSFLGIFCVPQLTGVCVIVPNIKMKKYRFYFHDFKKKVPGSLSKNKWKCPRKNIHTHPCDVLHSWGYSVFHNLQECVIVLKK